MKLKQPDEVVARETPRTENIVDRRLKDYQCAHFVMSFSRESCLKYHEKVMHITGAYKDLFE